MMPADIQNLEQHCPVEVVEYVRNQDVTTTRSLFWPDTNAGIDAYSGQCHLAVLGYVVDDIGPRTSWAGIRSALGEMTMLSDHMSEDLVNRSAEALRRIAARHDGLEFGRIYFIAKKWNVDLRESFYRHAPRPAELDAAMIDSVVGMANYALYLAEMGEEDALDAYAGALELRKDPAEIRRGLDALFDLKVPGRERVLRAYIDDPRQERDTWGGRGLVLAQAAREMLDLPDYTGPRRLLDGDGNEVAPMKRPFETTEETRPRLYRVSPPPPVSRSLLRWD